MPKIDLREYAEVQFFQYPLRRVLTANQRDEAGVIKVQEDSDFLIQKIVGTATSSTYDVQINDRGTGRNLFSAIARSTVVVGTAQNPNILLIPHKIFANASLGFTLLDGSGAGNTIEIVLEGVKGYKRTAGRGLSPRGYVDLARYREVHYYGYQFLTATALSANASTVIPVTTDADSDFLIEQIVGRQTGTYRLRITDTATGRQFSDALVDNANLVGTAQNPNVLFHPQLVLAASTLTIELTDSSGAGNTIEIVLLGRKLFRR